MVSSLLFVSLSVDGLDQDSLVLVLVTLGVEVEGVVQALVDLAGLSVLAEQSSEGSLSSDPEDLDWESGVAGTSSLTDTGVSSSSLGDLVESGSGARVDLDTLLDNETVLNKLLEATT